MTDTQRRVGLREDLIFEEFSAGKLLVSHCRNDDCGFARLYPFAYCPNCRSKDLEVRYSSGRGEIHTLTINYRRSGEQTVVVVELTDGGRVLSSLTGSVVGEPLSLVGRKVEIDVEASASKQFPVFRLS